MGGSDTGSDKKNVFSVILQNRPGNRSAYFLVMLRSDIGSQKNYRLPIFRFWWEIIKNRLCNRAGQFLVMFQSDTGFDTDTDTDTGFRNFFSFFTDIDLGVDKTSKNVKLVMGGSDTGSDKKTFFRLFFKIDLEIDRHTF